jgi:hypothetical protein
MGFSLPGKCDINGLNMAGGHGVINRNAEKKPLLHLTVMNY